MKNETKKQKWQRYAKKMNVKFQQNDTIVMLVAAVAGKLKLNVDSSEKVVEDAILLKKDETTKSQVKTIVNKKTKKKVQVSKPVVVELKKDDKNEVKKEKKDEVPVIIGVTEFDTMDQLKSFCIKNQLNKLPGYILITKKKKTDFWNWIIKNIKHAKPIKDTSVEKAKKIAIEMGNGTKENNIIDGSANEELNAYANSILSYINESPAVKLRGVLPLNEFNQMIKSALTCYTYNLKNDNVGKFLIVSNGKNTVRVPQQGYLPMD